MSQESAFDTADVLPKRLETQIATSAPAVGKILRGRSVAHLVDLFHELCAAADVSTLIECGAREAEASDRFTRENETRSALALEANPFTHENLTSRVAGPRLITLPEGLAERPGELTLIVPSDGTSQPMPGNGSFLMSASEGERLEVRVPVTTLDMLGERFAVAGAVALWVDVEGFSREVLLGGSRMLAEQVHVALVEVETAPMWEGAALESEITELLRSFDLIPVARDLQESQQYNVLYLHTRFLPVAQRHIDGFRRRTFRDVTFGERLRFTLRSVRKRGPLRVIAGRLKRGLFLMLGPERSWALKRTLGAGHGPGSAD